MLKDRRGHGLMVPKLMSGVVDLIFLVTEHFKNTKNWGGGKFPHFFGHLTEKQRLSISTGDPIAVANLLRMGVA